MCKDAKKEHKCCGQCKKDFDKSAPKDGGPNIHPPKPGVVIPPRRTCGTPPPPPEKK